MTSSVRKIAEITDYLYLCGVGGITERNLSDCGITHVLNTAVELKEFKYPTLDLNICHILMRDSPEENLLEYLERCIEFIHKARLSGKKTLVHCVAGASRSASVCIAYLVKYENMKLMDAHSHVLSQREVIFPNIGFWKCLVEFEEIIRGETSVELRPYICGLIPSFKEDYAAYLIRIGWMQELMAFWMLNIFIMVLQILAIIIF